jgi:transcriptional regulator with XRE-family HTH domain
MSFQDNLRKYRTAAGFSSAQEFADFIGVPYTTYVGYESKGREPRYEMLCKIATALNCTLNDLLGYSPSKCDSFPYYARMLESASESYSGMDIVVRDDGSIYIDADEKIYRCSFTDKEEFVRYMESAEHGAAESYQYTRTLFNAIADMLEDRHHEQLSANAVNLTIESLQRALSEATPPEERGKLKQALKKALSELESSE